MRNFFLNTRFYIEYTLIRLVFFILYFVPINISSKFGAILFRFFGRFSKSHVTAIKNCRYVLPDLSEKEVEKIVFKSWENLGKNIFEIGKLKKIINQKDKIEIHGFNNITEITQKKIPSIYFSIHHSNWEICPPLLNKLGINVGVIYRHINNHFINNFVLDQRSHSLKLNRSFYTRKGKQSAKDILETVKNKNSVFLLIDQKDSAGEEVVLFKKRIKTQIGFLKIARKYKMPLIPMENKRLNNNSFLITFHKPIFHKKAEISDLNMMHEIHSIIEKWILKNPTQWFWQHNRFS